MLHETALVPDFLQEIKGDHLAAWHRPQKKRRPVVPPQKAKLYQVWL